MYNLMHEYLECSAMKVPCDLTDFKSVEKCIGNSEIDIDVNENSTKKPKLRTSEVISVLKQFIESSNYAEFGLRMKILKSFEFYLQYITIGSNKKRTALISIIHNLHSYYTQFSAEIEDAVKNMRTPIEKKLKEFVKIESYNKDLSYYSMKNNVARVHRHLHKFLREFETALMGKIASVFVWRANQTHSLGDESNDKGINLRYQPKVTYYMIDVKTFMASQKLKEKYTLLTDELSSNTTLSDDSNLLSKIDKLFTTSRNIVKQAVLHTQFPSLIYNLDTMLADQIENCNYLRKLEVDRSQEKPKQKSQAKHILQQKRKALADSYKQLTTLGLSYRGGLLEASLKSELVDLKIAPFCLSTMIGTNMKHKKIYQNLMLLNENLNLNFARCVFKLKLLQTVMLTPNPELGMLNIERIKGFTVDLFLLVQSQRESLSKTTIELHQLQQHIDCINDLHTIITSDKQQLNFNVLMQKFGGIERALNRILAMVEQFELLMKCPPADEDDTFSTISSNNVAAFTKSSNKYQQTKSTLSSVAQSAEKLLAHMQSNRNVMFHSASAIEKITNDYECIVKEINDLCEALKLNSCEYIVLIQPLVQLLEDIEVTPSIDTVIDHNINDENHSNQNMYNELANIVHQVLLSMQNIYKKYSVQKENLYEDGSTVDKVNETNKASETTVKPEENNVVIENGNASDTEEADHLIEENHLKRKINEEMQSDLVTLNLPTILSKLSNIITVLRYTSDECQADLPNRIECIRKLVSIVPILEQYDLLCKYYLIQQFGAHKVTTKMLNVMLTVFIELGAKGFCIPPDLMQDEDGEKNDNGEGKEGGDFGLEDGTGEKDVSDK